MLFRNSKQRRLPSGTSIKNRLRSCSRRGRLAFEPLEDRRMLTTIMVDSLEDIVAADGVVTFREAVEAANTNIACYEAPAGSASEIDQIQFDPQLFDNAEELEVLQLIEGALEITDDVNIQGPGEDVLVLDGGYDGAYNAAVGSRVITVSDGDPETALNVTITGIAFANGNASAKRSGYTSQNNDIPKAAGGGIFNEEHLVLENVRISGCVADWGGGIENTQTGSLSLSDVTISDCYSNYHGGGIRNDGGRVVGENVSLDNNDAFGYWTAAYGGGAYNGNEGVFRLTDSTVSGNWADDGGGLCNGSGTMIVTDTRIAANTVDLRWSGDGGGVMNQDELYLIQCVIVNNCAYGSSEGRGGGLYGYTGTATITNCTIADNQADNIGGGIYVESSATLVLNNTLLDNANDDIVGDFTGDGNLWDIDPVFADRAAGDYRLTSASPAVNHGVDSVAVNSDGNPLLTDFHGRARVVDGTVDAGAYEFALSGILGDLNNDFTVNSADLDTVRGNWGLAVSLGSLRDGDPSGDGVVNSDDLNIVRANWGATVAAAAAESRGAGAQPSFTAGPRREIGEDALDASARRLLAQAAWEQALEAVANRDEDRKEAVLSVDTAFAAWDNE